MKKLPPMKAIAANCKDCIYDPHEAGTHTRQIENCSISTCHLYLYRPLTRKTRAKQKENHLATLSDDQREIALESAEKRRVNMANIRHSQLN